MCSLFDYFVDFVSILFHFFFHFSPFFFTYQFCFCLSLPLKRSFDCEQKKVSSTLSCLFHLFNLCLFFIHTICWFHFSLILFSIFSALTHEQIRKRVKSFGFLCIFLCVSLFLFDSLILYIFTPTIIYNMHELFFSLIDSEYFVLCFFFS